MSFEFLLPQHWLAWLTRALLNARRLLTDYSKHCDDVNIMLPSRLALCCCLAVYNVDTELRRMHLIE